MAEQKVFIAIDLKSFYASQECVERGLDPMTTNLVVADSSRTDKTICLAVTPALKSWGVPGRARLFEVIQRVQQINSTRILGAPGGCFRKKSWDDRALREDPSLEMDFIIAPPRMAQYIITSSRIYQIYLRFVAPEDIHVYSIDEVFLDATSYLKVYGLTATEFARMLISRVQQETGISAAAGIGSNLYLSKVAMDIVAKHICPGPDGTRVAQLDEEEYRKRLWSHRPLTDFWRVGRGYARKLESHGMFTMGDIARCSLENEGLLFRLFGVNAELLIDHAWGWEPCAMGDIKAYQPENHSLGSGQVLPGPYTWEKARIVTREMADQLVLDLMEKGLTTDQVALTIGYDRESLADPEIRAMYRGQVSRDCYGRAVPKHSHGSRMLSRRCASDRIIAQAVMELYDRITDSRLLVRRINLTACSVRAWEEKDRDQPEQLDFFGDSVRLREEDALLEREKRRQQAVLQIRKKYGKNAIMKGMSLMEGATARVRNQQIGGHKA